MGSQLGIILSLPMKVIAASYTLNLAADTAVKIVDDKWIPKAHRLCRVIGMDGFVAFLGSFGLFLAFLTCTFRIAAGFLFSSRRNTVLQPRDVSSNVFTGLCVFSGCTFSATFVFFFFVMLFTLEVKGLLLSGFLLAAVLLMDYKHQHYDSRRVGAARCLILHSVTFITLQLSVETTYNLNNPVFIILLPFVLLLGYSADKIAFQKPRGHIILSFMIAVVLTGLVLGFSIDEYYLKNPLLSETASTLRSVVYKMALLTGLVGAIAGSMTANVWMEQEAYGLSLWICGPVAVILFNLDVDSPASLHGVLIGVLDPGGELGLVSGFAAASGFSLGLVLKHAQILLPPETIFTCLVVVGLFLYYCLSSINGMIVAAVVLSLGLLSAMDQDELVPLQDVAWDLEILAKVMMGATILGLAVLLTGSLGETALSAVILAFLVVTCQAWLVADEK